MEQVKIRKHSGELDIYSEEKLRESLRSAGASDVNIESVVSSVKEQLYDGISTKEIYRHAHHSLKKQTYVHSSKYRLKSAIQELGPTGYPFELFIAELMNERGYHTQVGLNISGKCVMHEVDVLAENSSSLLMMECKFHNKPGYKSDVKVPLYIHSRFNDLNEIWKTSEQYHDKKTEGWIVTNSRFTSDAIAYAECAGLRLLSWDYPEHLSLKKLIHQHQLFPLTSLQSLTKRDKNKLMEEGMVSAKTLCKNFDLLDMLHLTNSQIQKVMTETNLICEK